MGRMAARAKIEDLITQLAALRQAGRIRDVDASDELDARERAVLTAHRWHATACATLGRDVHNPAHAAQAAGLGRAGGAEVILRGAVARHHGLHSVSVEQFEALDGTQLRALQRAGRRTHGLAAHFGGPVNVRLPELLGTTTPDAMMDDSTDDWCGLRAVTLLRLQRAWR